MTDDYVVDAIYLYLPEIGQVLCSNEFYACTEVSDEKQICWLEETEKPLQAMFFQNPFGRVSQNVFAYRATLYRADSSAYGATCVTVDERELYYMLLDPMKSTQESVYQIISPREMVCSTQSTQLSGKQQSLKPDSEWLSADYYAPFSGFTLRAERPKTELAKQIADQKYVMRISLFILFVTLLVLSMWLARWLSRPLQGLVSAIDRVSQGDFTARVQLDETEEFAAVDEHFNQMVERVDLLMKQVVEEHTEKQHAELKALQYQIRPHFMYNTLNSIRFAAMIKGDKKIAEQLAAFIALLEPSVQKKGAFVTVNDEIGLVRAFVSLQKFKYSDCFSMDYQIDKQAENCYVPCLLLQPFIENAIFHGIDTEEDGNRISLRIQLNGDKLEFEIADNGRGMTEEERQKLLLSKTKLDDRRLTGIGLQNVQQRLTLYYGDAAGFTLESALGQGTTVRITLLARFESNEYQ